MVFLVFLILHVKDNFRFFWLAGREAVAKCSTVWFFRRRLPLYWYATDLNAPPVGDNKMRWPGTEWVEGNFHKLFPSFAEFWGRDGAPEGPVPEPAPIGEFLNRMRRGKEPPKVKVRAD